MSSPVTVGDDATRDRWVGLLAEHRAHGAVADGGDCSWRGCGAARARDSWVSAASSARLDGVDVRNVLARVFS